MDPKYRLYIERVAPTWCISLSLVKEKEAKPACGAKSSYKGTKFQENLKSHDAHPEISPWNLFTTPREKEPEPDIIQH